MLRLTLILIAILGIIVGLSSCFLIKDSEDQPVPSKSNVASTTPPAQTTLNSSLPALYSSTTPAPGTTATSLATTTSLATITPATTPFLAVTTSLATTPRVSIANTGLAVFQVKPNYGTINQMYYSLGLPFRHKLENHNFYTQLDDYARQGSSLNYEISFFGQSPEPNKETKIDTARRNLEALKKKAYDDFSERCQKLRFTDTIGNILFPTFLFVSLSILFWRIRRRAHDHLEKLDVEKGWISTTSVIHAFVLSSIVLAVSWWGIYYATADVAGMIYICQANAWIETGIWDDISGIALVLLGGASVLLPIIKYFIPNPEWAKELIGEIAKTVVTMVFEKTIK